MKDIYTKLNEALAKLKEGSASKHSEVTTKLSTINSTEAKLNCVNEALKESNPLGLPDIEESKRDPAVAILFGVEPRTAPTTKETAPITKHNGAAENFVEGSPLNEGRTAGTLINSTRDEKRAASDKMLHEAMGLSAEQHRILTGGKPAEYANLTEKQRKDYDFARLIGLSVRATR